MNGVDIENDSQSTKTKTQNEASPDDCSRRVEIDALTVIKQYTALLHDCIISLEDVYTTQFQSVQIVGRVADLLPVIKSTDDGYNEYEEDHNAVEEYEVAETYRGIVGIETEFYLILENSEVNWSLLNSSIIPPLLPHKDLINVYTKDNEHFPVLRRLLRPCISLTSTVQKGKGIYDDTKHLQIKNLDNRILSDNTFNIHQDTEESSSVKSYNNTENFNGNIVDNENENVVPLIIISNENENENEKDKNDNVTVEVDACTFDKVLLYLEHEVGRRLPSSIFFILSSLHASFLPTQIHVYKNTHIHKLNLSHPAIHSSHTHTHTHPTLSLSLSLFTILSSSSISISRHGEMLLNSTLS